MEGIGTRVRLFVSTKLPRTNIRDGERFGVVIAHMLMRPYLRVKLDNGRVISISSDLVDPA